MVTGLYAGILALIYMALSINVIVKRVHYKTQIGDNNNPILTRAIRIHGNFSEYAPLILILMALYELQAPSIYILHAMGIALVVGRLAHIWGLGRGVMAARALGTVLTMLLLASLGVLLILKGIILLQIS